MKVQELQEWLASRIDLERVWTDALRVIPNGVEQVRYVGHRLADYFAGIRMFPDAEGTPRLSALFSKNALRREILKDLMVNILEEVEATPQKAAIDLESKDSWNQKCYKPAPRISLSICPLFRSFPVN